MALTTTTGSSILTPEQVMDLVVRPVPHRRMRAGEHRRLHLQLYCALPRGGHRRQHRLDAGRQPD